jgi:glycosyltransferase involved in cell wall biosynthesis
MLSKARDATSPDRQNGEPLVSVIIPTRNRCGLLTGRAMPSVFKQSYRNIELIVVGDRCTDDTEQMVKSLQSQRVKFYRLPETAGRPESGYDAWLVVGVDASNMGIRLSSGDWIVHLDDDDELAPEHIEVLLQSARENDLEMVYGKVLVDNGRGERVELGSFPPELGKMTHSGVLFSSRLKFFSYDRNTWKYLEPGDWNLWRRMKEAGVRIGFVDRVLETIYPAGPGFYG